MFFAKLSGTWLYRGSYGVDMDVTGSSWPLRGLRLAIFVLVKISSCVALAMRDSFVRESVIVALKGKSRPGFKLIQWIESNISNRSYRTVKI